MRIFSWNVLYTNKDLDAVVKFIETFEFDVLALQEVPDELYARLEQLPYAKAKSVDVIKNNPDGTRTVLSLVILSRYPIEAVEEIVFPVAWYPAPTTFRAKFVAKYLKWHHPYIGKTGLRASVRLPNGESLQVFCAHLAIIFSTGSTRLKEFDYLMQRQEGGMPTIFCGDFNTLELPHITLLNFLGGGSLLDWLWWWRERAALNAKMIDYRLQSPLKGQMTHPIALSQIDHILVPETAQVSKKAVLKEKCGSDHNPVMAEITL